MADQYKSDNEIESVVRGFESCLTAKEDFSHQSHVTVGVWYLRRLPFEQATASMREGLFRFLDHYGLGRQKYHETMTVIWMHLIENEIAGLDPALSLLDLTNRVVENLSDSRLPFKYYSRELLMSDEARKSWVKPDLLSINSRELVRTPASRAEDAESPERS
jgi:hypothetical protein